MDVSVPSFSLMGITTADLQHPPFKVRVYREGISARSRNYSNCCNKIAFQCKAIFTAYCHVHGMAVFGVFQMSAARRFSWISFLVVKEGRITLGSQIYPFPCSGKNYILRGDSSCIEFMQHLISTD